MPLARTKFKFEDVAAMQIDQAIHCYNENTTSGLVAAASLALAGKNILRDLLGREYGFVELQKLLPSIPGMSETDVEKSISKLSGIFGTIVSGKGYKNEGGHALRHPDFHRNDAAFDFDLKADVFVNIAAAIADYEYLTKMKTPYMTEFVRDAMKMKFDKGVLCLA